jgi:glycosyltransferase involved in cell wall biosynthesis
VTNSNGPSHKGGLVLHVLPSALARGAQFYARALVDLLDEPGSRHQLMSIYSGDSGIEVDLSLGEPGGAAAAVGLDPRVVLRLRRFCAELSPAVLVAHGGDSLKYLVSAFQRVPIVYYAIGTVAQPVHTSVRRQVWRAVVARSTVVAAVSNDVAAECATLLRVPDRKLVVVPNGRDGVRFHPRPEPAGHGSGPPLLLFVGHLTSGKRPDVFIELVRQLRADGMALNAQIAGDGPMREELEQPARSAGVELLGSRSDISKLMRNADLMVFPSLPEGEGMPGVLIEAGLSGLCVLATAVPGVSDVVLNGVTGAIVEVSDFCGLVDQARQLTSEPARLEEMGRAARDHCESRFSMEASASEWRHLLSRVGSR